MCEDSQNLSIIYFYYFFNNFTKFLLFHFYEKLNFKKNFIRKLTNFNNRYGL